MPANHSFKRTVLTGHRLTQTLLMIKNLRNLGPQSAKMLAKAGIVSNEELKALGSVAAFLAVKRAGCSPSYNLLWALEGALTDQDWKEIARKDRLNLLIQLDDAERKENEKGN